jgi:hypothetical protein
MKYIKSGIAEYRAGNQDGKGAQNEEEQNCLCIVFDHYQLSQADERRRRFKSSSQETTVYMDE